MSKRSGYPDMYGVPTKALPDILGPLNIDQQGDNLVPANDMAEVGKPWVMGSESRDPLGVLIKGGK
jgi:hypothetical protein